MSKFKDWVMEALEGVSITKPLKKPIKAQIKKAYKVKEDRVITYQPKLSFERKDK